MDKATARQELLHKYMPVVRDYFTADKKAASIEDLNKFMPQSPYILYVHLPFCDNICRDCTYRRDSKLEDIEKYCDILIKEIELLGNSTAKERGKATAIYFGGGTPSLIPIKTLTKIIEKLKHYFFNDYMPEMSLEINPSSYDRGNLDAYRDLGINRLSLGIQSFHDAPLKEMGRTYTADLARTVVQETADAGWNFNIDLIFGFDAQTPQMFYDDVDYAINNGVSHIATYNLLRRMSHDKKEKLLSDQSDIYYHIRNVFKKAGFIQYFINEFARNKDSICEYTNGRLVLPRTENLCFGTAGEGGTKAGGIYKKYNGRKSYMESIEKGVIPAFFIKTNDPHIPLTVLLMDMMRGMEKMDTNMFKQQFGVDPTEIEFIKDLEKYGFINIDDDTHTKTINMNEEYLFEYNAFYNDIKYFEFVD